MKNKLVIHPLNANFNQFILIILNALEGKIFWEIIVIAVEDSTDKAKLDNVFLEKIFKARNLRISPPIIRTPLTCHL